MGTKINFMFVLVTRWQQLRRVIACATYPVILIIDANGKLGSIADSSIGPGGHRQNEDTNGIFLKIRVDFDLCMLASFVDIHHDHATHCGNRIDYIARPMADKPLVIQATTLRDFDAWVRKRRPLASYGGNGRISHTKTVSQQKPTTH